MVIRLILFLILAYFGVKTVLLLGRYFRRRSEQRTHGPEKTMAVNDMVRDPVCGVYIASEDALTIVRKGAKVFFCSEECRRRFLNGHR